MFKIGFLPSKIRFMKKLLFLILLVFGITQPAFSIIGCAKDDLKQPVENQRIVTKLTARELVSKHASASYLQKKARFGKRVFSGKTADRYRLGKLTGADNFARISVALGISSMLLIILGFATVFSGFALISFSGAVLAGLVGMFFGMEAIQKGTSKLGLALFGVIFGSILWGGLIFLLIAARLSDG